jgi:hypothetical protein
MFVTKNRIEALYSKLYAELYVERDRRHALEVKIELLMKYLNVEICEEPKRTVIRARGEK